MCSATGAIGLVFKNFLENAEPVKRQASMQGRDITSNGQHNTAPPLENATRRPDVASNPAHVLASNPSNDPKNTQETIDQGSINEHESNPESTLKKECIYSKEAYQDWANRQKREYRYVETLSYFLPKTNHQNIVSPVISNVHRSIHGCFRTLLGVSMILRGLRHGISNISLSLCIKVTSKE